MKKTEAERIIDNLRNTNEMAAYIKTKRHLDNYCASQQLNNLYMKNKNEPKLRYLFGEEKKESGFDFIKSFITIEGPKENENTNYDSIKQMKDLLYSFSTTTTGISNALIFLDERKNVINNLDYYNFNPWKADWIYSKSYKKERKELIDKIRNKMDYKGEVSDDEDSIIKYDETQDDLSETLVKYNRESINLEEKPNYINEDKPMISNAELITGKVNTDEISEEIVNQPIIKEKPKSNNQADLIKPIALHNQFLDNRLYYYNVYEKNKEILSQNNSQANYISIFGNSFSQSNLLGDNNLIPSHNYKSSIYYAKQ